MWGPILWHCISPRPVPGPSPVQAVSDWAISRILFINLLHENLCRSNFPASQRDIFTAVCAGLAQGDIPRSQLPGVHLPNHTTDQHRHHPYSLQLWERRNRVNLHILQVKHACRQHWTDKHQWQIWGFKPDAPKFGKMVCWHPPPPRGLASAPDHNRLIWPLSHILLAQIGHQSSTTHFSKKQECIPVGCVPPTCV